MKPWYALLLLSAVFLTTRIFALTSLPIFADEAIYIRWSQLIMDEPVRYAFFALNDGKTPLFIWMLVPFQYLFSDQLFAGRFVAVLGGLVQLFAALWVTKLLGGKRTSQVTTAVLITLLPFWFFHHRIALMDGWLTAWITLTFGASLKVIQLQEESTGGKHNRLAQIGEYLRAILSPSATQLRSLRTWTLLGSVLFAAALWTKLPALGAIPSIVLPGMFVVLQKGTANIRSLIALLGVAAGGVFLFGLLIFAPSFSQLFNRGSDFLFPVSDVVFKGAWQLTIGNLPNYLHYFIAYLSPAVILLPAAGLFLPRNRARHLLLILAALSFILPIAILGKNVYPRYLLPGAAFLTVSMALTFEQLLSIFKPRAVLKGNRVTTTAQRFAGAAVILSIGLVVVTSFSFIKPSYSSSDRIPFVSADRTQYLTEWSSGHGIQPAVLLLEKKASQAKLAVATEGYFGTLPDGVLLYLHNRPQENLWVEGVGQPVGGLTLSFLEHAQEAEEVWLVVNSHRLLRQFPDSTLIAQYCRPDNAPCLQVWDITQYAQSELAYTQALGSDKR